MNFEEGGHILEATPWTLRTMLLHFPEPLLHANEGEGTWSIFEVVCHLAHAETDDWVPRLRIVLTKGTTQVFAHFDREAGHVKYAGWEIGALLNEFERLRRGSLLAIDEFGLGPQHMSLKGLHPVFGKVTVSELLAAWVCHDLTHIHQITRILASRYAPHAGPFADFMSLLRTAERNRRFPMDRHTGSLARPLT